MNYETDGEVFIKHPENVRIGEGVFIGHGTFIDGYHNGDGVIISDGAWIGQQCYISGAGGVRIGANVGVAPGCKVFSSSHALDGTLEIIHNRISFSPVYIAPGCDIGVGSIVLPGVTIGSFSQIGAGSVVTRSLPSQSIAAGNPAKVIGDRR